MLRAALISAAILVLGLGVGCGSDSSSDGDTSGSTASDEPFSIGHKKSPIRYEEKMTVGPSGLSGEEPKPVIPDSPPPDSIALVDLVEGIGRFYVDGEKMTVQYVGYDYETKEKFASSWDEGKPFTFTLGAGEVIPGWEEGLAGLEGGDRRELVLPPDTTEGASPPNIPQGRTVVFVVEPVPVTGKSAKAAAPKPKNEAAEKTASGPKKKKPKVEVPGGPSPKKLVVEDLEEGNGPVAKAGDEVSVQYVGVGYDSKEEFDASWDRGEPFTFTLGAGEVIPGWDQGVAGMKVGGRRELIIPPGLAYGAAGSPPSIGPNEALVFVVDLEAAK